MNDAFICDAIRTPIGRYGGALATVRADDLAAVPCARWWRATRRSTGRRVDDVVLGCANQAGEDNRNVARMALLLAGLPYDVPAVTVNRLCGSGLEAVGDAARAIAPGEAELRHRRRRREHDARAVRHAPRRRGVRRAPTPDLRHDDRLALREPADGGALRLHSMGETAENVAEKCQVSRADQDAFALRSQQQRARGEGAPAPSPPRSSPVTMPAEEGRARSSPRTSTRARRTLEALAKLKPRSAGRHGHRGQLRPPSTTAPRAPGRERGRGGEASASSRSRASSAWPTAGVEPHFMGEGPIPARKKAARACGAGARRHRPHRAERGVRRAGARLHRGLGLRRRAGQPERRRHRARPPARRERRAHR